jgi:hypothetical protein
MPNSPQTNIDQFFPLSGNRVGRIQVGRYPDDHRRPESRGQWYGGLLIYTPDGSYRFGVDDLRCLHAELAQIFNHADDQAWVLAVGQDGQVTRAPFLDAEPTAGGAA